MQQANDFLIVGPDMTPNNGVSEAINSLSFLPSHFKLLLPRTNDLSFAESIRKSLQTLSLHSRVRFIDDIDHPAAQAVLVASATPTDFRDERIIISRQTPEALATAILRRARQLYKTA
ncbi:MAG TPA: hypothetical protein VLF91_03380 [Candidatus Saccharimonadales bacterium]|nr:hypothetical protein [Candidatus Saccharimonadales bacterium]